MIDITMVVTSIALIIGSVIAISIAYIFLIVGLSKKYECYCKVEDYEEEKHKKKVEDKEDKDRLYRKYNLNKKIKVWSYTMSVLLFFCGLMLLFFVGCDTSKSHYSNYITYIGNQTCMDNNSSLNSIIVDNNNKQFKIVCENKVIDLDMETLEQDTSKIVGEIEWLT